MHPTAKFKINEIIRNIGMRSIIASLFVFLLTISATCIGGYQLYKSTKESIHLQGKVNAVQSAKEFDGYLIIRKNTVMLAGSVVDEMIREGKPNSEILDYLTAESLSIKKSIDMDYTGLYGWINNEYLDGVGWVPDADYIPTQRPWYTETINDDSDITFIRPYLDEQTHTVLTTMTQKLSDNVSVIALDVTLGRIQEITEEIARQTPGSYGMVLDKTGQVIAHSDSNELGKNYLEEKGTLGAALAEKIYAADQQEFELNFNNERYIVFVERIEGDWQSVSLINTNMFYQPLKTILILSFLFTLLEAIVLIVVFYNQAVKNLALASAREAESASRAKSAFLSQMSHEIRTPINAIIGLDSIALRDESISPHTRDELEKISTSAKHLLSIINDILDISRIESGRMVLKEEPFSFAEFIDQIKIIINGQCEDKGLEFICQVSEPLEEYYRGDGLKLKQAIINILGNSVKFTDAPGTINFAIRQTALEDDKATLVFTMEDTGIGMDKDYLPRLFDAFSQEDSGNTTRYGGSGLGMAITKNIIDMMDGNIEVQSEKGKGSKFTVTVKLGLVHETIDTEVKNEIDENISLEGLHVLIAEDQDINAEVLLDLLELENISAEWAQNGRIAVELFEGSEPGHFDAILMDMRMPEMDGLSAAREIRKLSHPDATDIPIIALTANAFEEDVRHCLEAGMNAHLSKPVDIDLLKDKLRELFRDKKES